MNVLTEALKEMIWFRGIIQKLLEVLRTRKHKRQKESTIIKAKILTKHSTIFDLIQTGKMSSKSKYILSKVMCVLEVINKSVTK